MTLKGYKIVAQGKAGEPQANEAATLVPDQDSIPLEAQHEWGFSNPGQHSTRYRWFRFAAGYVV